MTARCIGLGWNRPTYWDGNRKSDTERREESGMAKMGGIMKLLEAIQDVQGALDGLMWRECADYGAPDDTYEWYYAESGVYIIRHKKLKTCFFTKARSPEDAFNKLRKQWLA